MMKKNERRRGNFRGSAGPFPRPTAARVAAGDSLVACAAELKLSYETARNRLKANFAKTNVHRQAELVALFARLLSGDGG